jgi:hypothetical protein
VPNSPSLSTANLLEVRTRVQHARHVVTGFTRTAPALADLWRQVDEALSDIPALATEVSGLRAQLIATRLDRANLAAAAQVTITACLDGEPDPLDYLRDELRAQGFDSQRRDA